MEVVNAATRTTTNMGWGLLVGILPARYTIYRPQVESHRLHGGARVMACRSARRSPAAGRWSTVPRWCGSDAFNWSMRARTGLEGRGGGAEPPAADHVPPAVSRLRTLSLTALMEPPMFGFMEPPAGGPPGVRSGPNQLMWKGMSR